MVGIIALLKHGETLVKHCDMCKTLIKHCGTLEIRCWDIGISGAPHGISGVGKTLWMYNRVTNPCYMGIFFKRGWGGQDADGAYGLL